MIQELPESNTVPWQTEVRLGTFAGRDGKHWWSVTPTGFQCVESDTGVYRLNGRAVDIPRLRERIATEFLRLGMYEVDGRTFQITERSETLLRFRARSVDGGTAIEGTATVKDGSIVTVEYPISGSERLEKRRINLIHNNGALEQAVVYAKWRGSSEWDRYAVYQVLRWEFADTHGTSTSCRQFIRPNDFHVVYDEEGNAQVLQHPNVSGVASGMAAVVEGTGRERRVRSIVGISFLAASALMLAGLLWRYGGVQKK